MSAKKSKAVKKEKLDNVKNGRIAVVAERVSAHRE